MVTSKIKKMNTVLYQICIKVEEREFRSANIYTTEQQAEKSISSYVQTLKKAKVITSKYYAYTIPLVLNSPKYSDTNISNHILASA